jgi:putative ABC transport system permease protein
MPFRLIVAHWRRNFLRTALTTLSVAVAVFLFCSLRTLLTTLESVVKNASTEKLITSNAVSLFASLRLSMRPRIESMSGVRRVGHHTWFGGTYVDPKNFFARFAVDVSAFRDIYGDRAPKGPVFTLGAKEWDAFESERNSCIVGAQLAKEYGFEVGKPIALTGDIFPVDPTFIVRGIYESDNPAYDDLTLFFHWTYLDELIGERGECSLFVLDVGDPGSSGDIAREVDAAFRNSARPTITQSEQAFSAQFLTMWGNVALLFNSIGTVVLFACFLVTLNTMLMAARERVREVGVLKTLGFSDGSVGALYLVDGILLAVAGGLIGAGLARWWADGGPLKMGPVYFPVFRLEQETLLAGLGLALLLGIAAGLAPALMAVRLPIVKALRQIG